MKILFAGHSLFDSFGGGPITSYSLLRELSKKHTVYVLGIEAERRRYFRQDNLNIFEIPTFWFLKRFPWHLRFLLVENCFQKIIRNFTEEINPDIIINDSLALLSRRPRQKAKNIVLIQSLDGPGVEDKTVFANKIYNLPFFIIRHNRNKRFLNKADLVITNSLFMQRKLFEYGIESEVVYPFIELKNYIISKDFNSYEQKYITFVNLSRHKGGVIALKIAKSLPAKNFLFAIGQNPEKSLERQAKSLSNVKIVKWVNDMREVYSKSRLIIMPVVWEDPGPRLPIEAGINGIPTIASNRGGIPESVGRGGILIRDIWNIDEWIEAIKKLDNGDEYRQLSFRAIENAKKFDFEITFNKFIDVVKEKLQIEL